ncbi:MAG: hypothetical protein IH892_19570, partial [Planctomycetes bacterium]|nr:hypothetical protein [Planctomycetota bacterium]
MCHHLRNPRTLGHLLLLCALIPLVQGQGARGGTLAESLPAGALVYGEVSDLGKVLGPLEKSSFLSSLLALPAYQDFQATGPYRKVDAVRRLLEIHLGYDLWTAAEKLMGGDLAVALYPRPNSDQPDFLVVLRVRDAEDLAHLRDRIDPILTLLDQQITVTDHGDGMERMELGEDFVLAIGSDRLIVSNCPDRLTAMVAMASGPKSASLAQDESFIRMEEALGTDHLARLYVNTELLKSAGIRRLGLPEKMDNPLASLLLGGLLEQVTQSPYGGLTLDMDGEGFRLTAGVAADAEALGEEYACYFSHLADTAARTPLRPDRTIGGVSLFRNVTDWYGQREALLQAQLLPDFDKFEAGLANLLPGRDFEQDILPTIGSNFSLVAAFQDYSHLDGTPGVQLPGFALVVELAQPEEGAELLQLFFQTFSAILNIEAGKQGRQPWILDLQTHRGVKITSARYLQKPSGARLPMVFNFMPAAARVKDQFIISSSVGLCRDLIDHLQGATEAEPRGTNLALELDFTAVADSLDLNRDYFLARRVQEGRTPDQAQQDVDMALQVLRYL